jgi:hypothetical protein
MTCLGSGFGLNRHFVISETKRNIQRMKIQGYAGHNQNCEEI